MKTHNFRTSNVFEDEIYKNKQYNYEIPGIHLGTNSICLTILFIVFVIISYKTDALNWNYLKGLNVELSFFLGLFSIFSGVCFYYFWKLNERSVYSVHFVKTVYFPESANVIFSYKDFTFGLINQTKIKTVELSPVTRELFCIGILLNLALLTLDNSGVDKLIKFPSEIMQSKSSYCPVEDESIENIPPKIGCELIIRAYKLGYAKDLGTCEPEKTNPGSAKICEKRRVGEPYLHYMSRLLVSSVENKIDFFDAENIQKIADKFELQLQRLEVLKDYRTYAISAAPRASHHIWTNLPYPVNTVIQKFREVFRPNYCIGQFQNQTNTVRLIEGDKRKTSKLFEHVYGQLLFNPKSKITVGVCKEYKIHWNSATNVCEKLANNPKFVLEEENILSEVQLVLKRHDIANVLLNLNKEIQKIENKGVEKIDSGVINKSTDKSNYKKSKNKIVLNKIAKDRQQIRKKNELVSFQCFMQANGLNEKNIESNVTLDDTNFLVRTRFFPMIEDKGESQISMYREFSKVLEDNFYYSQLTSRSDVQIVSKSGDLSDGKGLLENPSYLFSRLEMLKNVDIFLGNDWVLERDDLLAIYPYHVHLENYVSSFRNIYKEDRGRL